MAKLISQVLGRLCRQTGVDQAGKLYIEVNYRPDDILLFGSEPGGR